MKPPYMEIVPLQFLMFLTKINNTFYKNNKLSKSIDQSKVNR